MWLSLVRNASNAELRPLLENVTKIPVGREKKQLLSGLGVEDSPPLTWPQTFMSGAPDLAQTDPVTPVRPMSRHVQR